MTDLELEKFFIAHKEHKGKALEGLAESLQWRCTMNLDAFDFTELDATGKLFFQGHALDGSPIVLYIFIYCEMIHT